MTALVVVGLLALFAVTGLLTPVAKQTDPRHVLLVRSRFVSALAGVVWCPYWAVP